MKTQTAMRPLALGFGLILIAAAGCATTTPPPNAETREAGNPNSVMNKDAPPPRQAAQFTYTEEANAAEAATPDSVANKDAPPPPVADKQTFDAESRAAEHANPDSVDDRLPSPTAILQRLHAFDQDAIMSGKLASTNGGPGAAEYGTRLVNDRQANELSVADLALKYHVALNEISDGRARKELAVDQSRMTEMKTVTGPAFDRIFAKHIAKEQHRELETVIGLRNRCVEQPICDLLAKMQPELERSVNAAQSLTAAVAVDDPRP